MIVAMYTGMTNAFGNFRLHAEALRSGNESSFKSSLVSPANYIRCIRALRSIYVHRSAELESRRALRTAAVAKFEEMEQQMLDLCAERTELRPKMDEVERQLVEEGQAAEKSAFHEFTQHQGEVTQVCFGKTSSIRLFSASLDKSVRVYDISERICIKTIQT